MDWVKIEPGCEMPNDGDFCIVIVKTYENGAAQLAWKEWDGQDWHNRGIVDKNENPSHWARVDLPNN